MLLIKGRAFYQKLERSLVHRLVVDVLVFERVDRAVVDQLAVDRLQLVELDDRLVVHRVDWLLLGHVVVLFVDQLLVERWLVDRLIVKLLKQQKDHYIPRP